MAAGFDLDAYLLHIGYDGPRAPAHVTLAGVVLRHALSIPFENIDAFLGRRPSLEPGQVAAKLVHGGRGGWCFEQNLLLGEALRALGFDVTDLAGRVVWNRPPDAVVPRTHRLLWIRLEGRDWLADVGFGGQTLTGVLDLHSDDEQATPHEPFRLRRLARGERMLESLVRGEWLPMFRFDLHPQQAVDFEAANFQLAHDPDSHFTQTLVASRVVADGRWTLRGRELAFHALGDGTERWQMENEEAILDVLGRRIGIQLEGMPELRRRVAGMLA